MFRRVSLLGIGCSIIVEKKRKDPGYIRVLPNRNTRRSRILVRRVNFIFLSSNDCDIFFLLISMILYIISFFTNISKTC